jgi:hypothetical protein
VVTVPFRRLLILATLIILSGCGGDRQAPGAKSQDARPSQILITIEAFAGRRAAPFGGPVEMPNLAKLVSAGTTYDDAVSTTTLARPALVTILTGVCPDRSGVRDNIHDALGGEIPTLAERAKSAGYETAAFVTTPFASYSSGLQRGFDVFDGPEAIAVGPSQHAPPTVVSKVIAANVKEWLASRTSDAPYFAWIHLADLNSLSVPLPLPKIQTGDKAPGEFALYDAALGSIDRGLGTIADAIRVDPRSHHVEWTIVATHGAYLGERDRFGEAFWLANETLHVPLVRIAARGPNGPAATHDARPTWLPDVAATLAKAMGFGLDARADGVALDVQPAGDRARLAWGYALDDQLGWPPQTAVREADGFAVFTAGADGNLSAAGLAGEAASASARSRPALPRPRVLPAEARTAVERAGLKLGRSSAPVLPKKPEEWLRDLQIVRRFESIERPALAARRSKILLEGAPDALASLVTRIYFFVAQPNKIAPELQRKLLARFPERSDALHWAAHASLVEKNYAAAEALFDAAMAVGPVEPEMRYDVACVRSLRGDTQGALAELDRALAAGYRNWDWIDKDPDLAAMRADAGFPALLRTHGR